MLDGKSFGVWSVEVLPGLRRCILAVDRSGEAASAVKLGTAALGNTVGRGSKRGLKEIIRGQLTCEPYETCISWNLVIIL